MMDLNGGLIGSIKSFNSRILSSEIGVNGGTIGYSRVSTYNSAIGIWDLNEHVLYRRIGNWPFPSISTQDSFSRSSSAVDRSSIEV